MKTKLAVSIVVLVIAGLFGSALGFGTDIPLRVSDPLYREALALEKEFPEIDVWQLSSDGEFLYVAIYWLEVPTRERAVEISDTVDEMVVRRKSTEWRIVFYDIILDSEGNYVILNMISCLAMQFGTDAPFRCNRYPWPLFINPADFPWVGR